MWKLNSTQTLRLFSVSDTGILGVRRVRRIAKGDFWLPRVHPRGSTRLPLDGFLLNLIFELFLSKIYRENLTRIMSAWRQVSRLIRLRMRNVLYKRCGEKQNTHFIFKSFPPPPKGILCHVWYTVWKYGTARQATDDGIIRRMRVACWITKVTRTRLNIAFMYIACLVDSCRWLLLVLKSNGCACTWLNNWTINLVMSAWFQASDAVIEIFALLGCCTAYIVIDMFSRNVGNDQCAPRNISEERRFQSCACTRRAAAFRTVGRVSSVGIANRYGLDGPGIESNGRAV